VNADPRLGAVLARLGVPGPAVALTGGTNASAYRVNGLVVRLLRQGDAALAADRARRAAATGAAPAVVAQLPDLGALVVEHVTGRTLTDADLRDPAVLRRAAAAVRRLHTGEWCGRALDMRAVLDAYAAAPDLPAGWTDSLPAARRLVDELCGGPTVLCHGDLVAANLVDAGDRVWLVDLDDAVDADPAFDLGNLWVQAGLGESHLVTLATAYGSGMDVDRVRRWALAVAYTWTAWSRQRALDPVPAGYDPIAFGDRLWTYARDRLTQSARPIT
jgi:streptomycin 6-kinase